MVVICHEEAVLEGVFQLGHLDLLPPDTPKVFSTR